MTEIAKLDDYFPQTYESMEERFLDLAKTFDLKIDSIEVEGGKKVYFASYVPDTERYNLLGISMSSHGGEAPAGFAVIKRGLDEHINELKNNGIGFFVTTTMAPDSFEAGTRSKKVIRVDETVYVDGNRVWHENDRETIELDENTQGILQRASHILAPERPIQKYGQDLRRFLFDIFVYLAKEVYQGNGFKDVVKAIGAGNNDPGFRNTPFWGGDRNTVVYEKEKEELRTYLRSITNGANVFCFSDIHTGLGRYGELTAVSNHAPNSEGFESLLDIIPTVRSLQTDEFQTAGMMLEQFILNNSGADINIGVTCEFGTINGVWGYTEPLRKIRILFDVIRELQFLRNGAKNEDVTKSYERERRNAFCPNDPRWRKAVLQTTDEMFLRYINNLKSHASQ